ncbi:carboxylesterase family protein [Frigoribacterium sp. VKM Ac-2530]|uniref:carboxylesterase family protein n=1 Tax=Frigoribacterium sp. VKM Ac-2530 TaxID=2783822 RepID=UPI00188C3DC0|nr:carboxylesterase family protein [Frigoribacterium sp. VKM Ac-2530]
MSSAPETRTPETPAAETPAAAVGTAETGAAPTRTFETRTFETRVGTVVGRVDGDVVRVLGVPYAVAERFEAPRPAPPAVGDDGQPVPFLAFERAPASPQLASPAMQVLFDDAARGMVDSEHCQALSITLPADLAPGERLPVMVWIHGGAYVNGAGDLGVYDPRSLVVEQRVVVVAVTYRLGVLGFLGDGDRVPSNLGLLDQLEAVRWVHDTIDAFGGDPDTVTLFGQSSGGDSIAHLMISDGARGLFRRAIVQSAPLGLGRGRSAMSRAMLRVVGAPDPDATVEELLAGQPPAERAALRFGLRGGMPFGPQYGRAPLPAEEDRDAAWRDAAPHVDLLMGATTEETGLYVPLVRPLDVLTSLPVVGGLVRRVLVRATTGAVYGRDARRFVDRHRASGGRAVRYELSWAPRGSRYGAAHITDLPLLLGTKEAWGRSALLGESDWAEVDRLGRRVRQIWADFARTGTVAADAAAGASQALVLDRG